MPDAVGAAAGSALRQARKDIYRTPSGANARALLPAAGGSGDALPRPFLPLLGLLPKLVVDDTKVRHRLDDPLRAVVQTRHAPVSVRILVPLLPIPDTPTDVQFVVEDSGPSFAWP